MLSEIRGWQKLLLALSVVIQVGFCWAARTRSLRGDVDLRAFYTAGTMLRTGQAAQLYHYPAFAQIQAGLFHGGQVLPFLYPAVAAWLFVPLASVPYRVAFCLLLAVDLCLIVATVRILFPAGRRAWITVAVLGFFPVAMALMQGQITFLLLLLYAGFAYLLRQQKPGGAGLCLALAMVKFQVAIPVALLYLVWKQYRVVAGFIVGSSAMGALSVATTGFAATREYVAGLAGMGASVLLDPAAARLRYGMLASDMPNLHGLAVGLSTRHAVVATLTIGASLLLLALSSRCTPSITVALPAAMLVSYHLQSYDLVLLLVPLCLMRWSRWTWAGVLLIVVPVGPWLLVQGQTRWMALGVVAIWLGAALPIPAWTLPIRSRWERIAYRAKEQCA